MKVIMAIEPGVVGLGEIPIPQPQEYEALVRMEACAICNSTDQKLLHNEFYPGPFPAVLGHEVVSTVVEVGAKVVNFKPGDRVFRQRLGDHQVPGGRSCWGGFAQFGLVSDEWARQGLACDPAALPHDQQKLMIDVDPALAVTMVTLMETLDCVKTCGVKAGVSVAIVGSGPVGQSMAMYAKLLGARPVYAFGRQARHADRFNRICNVDAYVVGDDFSAELERILARGGFDIVIEAVGSVEALDMSVRLAGLNGKVFVYGIAPNSQNYRPDQLALPNVKRVGAVEGRAQKQLVEWIESGRVKLEDWISHRLPFADCRQAFDLVAQGKATKVVMLADS